MSDEAVKMTRKDVWKAIQKNPNKVFNWFAANIGIGLATMWVGILFYLVSQMVPSPSEKIIKGDLIVFVTTLCASSMGIFWEIKDEHFRGMRTTMSTVVIIFILLAASLGAFVSAPSDIKTFGINPNSVFWLSLLLFLPLGIFLSFLIYSMKLTLETSSYADDIKEAVIKETKEAKEQNTTSDNKKL